MITKDLPSDIIYAYALSKTLIKVDSPITVGVYSSCCSRIKMVLQRLEVHMEREAEERERKCAGRTKPRTMQASVTNFIVIVIKLLFYCPVLKEGYQRPDNVRYIFVRFSAWHFAGSDMLWAGLVMRLYEAFQDSFGQLLLSLYRVFQYKEKEVKKVITHSSEEWKSKRFCCIPLWLILIMIIIIGVLFLILPFYFGLPDVEDEKINGTRDGLVTVEGFAIAALGVPTVAALRLIFLIGKNLILNHNLKFKRSIDNEKVSTQLGFMNEIRKEIRILSSFIQFMEIFERRKIRLVLEITHLERCSSEKITGVLNAINILLSDKASPFISLLAVNPEILAKKVQEDQAYALLNRTVTLAFTVPQLCEDSKRKVFKNIVCGQSEIPEDCCSEDTKLFSIKASVPSVKSSTENIQVNEHCIPLLNINDTAEINVTFEQNEEELERFIESVFECIYDKGKLHNYITGDTISMRRIISSVRVSVTIMKALKYELFEEKIAAWAVLANQWPCRLSWILQCVEDDKQKAQIHHCIEDTIHFDDSKTLWNVFSESRIELHMIREKIYSLLDLDGDPELFEMFLKDDFRFTIKEADQFKLSTVSLDYSIQNELASIRGSSSLKDNIRKIHINPLPVTSVINMNMDDVCKEMAKLKLPDKYAEVIRKNGINGEALVYCKSCEIKDVLQMTLGEWTSFSIHFLGISIPTFRRLSTCQDKYSCLHQNADCVHGQN